MSYVVVEGIGGRNEVATRVSDVNDRRLQDLTPLLFELR